MLESGPSGPFLLTMVSRRFLSAYRLIKELWAFRGDRIAVRFVYEWHDDGGRWWLSHGNENWRFADGLMAERHASINDIAIGEADPLFRWPRGPQPPDTRD